MKPRNSNPPGRSDPPPRPGQGGRIQGQRIAHTHRPVGPREQRGKKPSPANDRARPTSYPNLLSQSDPGPRPESQRQRDLKNRLTGRDIIDRAVPRAEGTPQAERNWREGPRRHVRDSETTRVRRRRALDETNTIRPAARNRRRVDYWPFLLRGALAVLALECIAVALWSPRLRVTETVVEGNATIPTNRLLSDLALPKGRTLTLLPVGKMRDQVLREPVVDSAEIHRRLPGTVQLVIHERKPWASVRLPGGQCYIIDRKLVPFRAVDQPPVTLPRLELVQSSENAAPETPLLGKPLHGAGLAAVAPCLRWASANRFPLESVKIAANGQLCLNRRGDVPVQLGAVADLDRKLKALSVLLDRRSDLRTATNIAYVNLLAPDAPAIMPRAAPNTAQPGEKAAKAASGTTGMTATEVAPEAAPEPVARPEASPPAEDAPGSADVEPVAPPTRTNP